MNLTPLSRLWTRSERGMCKGCQFGPHPDYPPDHEELAPYRTMRFQPEGPPLPCHRDPTRPCVGLMREMALRPRPDGVYFEAQTAVRRTSFLDRLLARFGLAS